MEPARSSAIRSRWWRSRRRFANSLRRTDSCAIGSLKSNIGHLGEAAGVAAFIKTVLALQNRQIPPSLHYESPNPQIDFANSPFYVNAKLAPWLAPRAPPRRNHIARSRRNQLSCDCRGTARSPALRPVATLATTAAVRRIPPPRSKPPRRILLPISKSIRNSTWPTSPTLCTPAARGSHIDAR